jgi:tetratricopeptide (TPR) repeat protein
MRYLRSALGLCLLFALGGNAGAEDQRSAAREHFMKGTKYFDLGRFDEAIKEYEAAYELKDEPVLLYNIAQAHRLANHTKEAVHFYKAYLRRVPKAPNREEVETKVAELEKLIDQQARTQTLPPDNPMMPGERQPPGKGPTTTTSPRTTVATTTPPPSSSSTTPPPETSTTPPPGETNTSPSEQQKPITDIPTPKPMEEKPADNNAGKTKKIAGLALVGVGAAALIGGIVCSALAAKAGDDVSADAAAGRQFDPSKESAGKTDELVAGVMYGVGGAAVVAGAVVTYLGFREAKQASRAMVTPVMGPSYAGATLRLSF